MKPRTLRYLVGALVVLLALYAGASLLGGGEETPGAGSDLARALATVDTARLADLRIAGGGDTLTLRREDAGWRVGRHPADSAAVARLTASLADLDLSELASSNPANHGRLGLAADGARSVRLSGDGWGPVRLFVGEAGPYTGSAYVRVDGADRAWVVRGGLRGATPTGLDAWRDHTVAAVDSSRVQRIRLRRGEDRLELRRADERWTAAVQGGRGAGAAPTNGASVRGILGELVRLRASGFGPDSVGVEAADRELAALSAQGDTLVRLRMAERPEQAGFWVTRDGADAVWALGRYLADRLVPARDQLFGTQEVAAGGG